MKRIAVLLFLLSLFSSLFASVSVSSDKGSLITEIKSESDEERILKAFSSEFTENWIESYLIDDSLLVKSYTSALSSALPLENSLLFRKDGFFIIYSQKSNAEIILSLDNGKISSLYFL